jgi:hypothetical protein
MRKLIGFYAIGKGENMTGNSGYDLHGFVINAYTEKLDGDKERFFPAVLAPVALAGGVLVTLDRNPKVIAITQSQGTRSLTFPTRESMDKYIRDNFGDFEFSTPEDILGE